MPKFSKKSLSIFLRNQCERQFVLSLYTDTERAAHGMPTRQPGRSGLGLAGQAGYSWQDEKVSELKDVFGTVNVHMNPATSYKRPGTLPLLDTLPKVQPYQFVVEAVYDADTVTFRTSVSLTSLVDNFGNKINIGATHPDIIQVFPPLSSVSTFSANVDRNPYELGVLPDGETFNLAPTDSRLRLRVIDIKLTSEPGAHYFAEVVYYSMTLAGWLVEHNLDKNFVVVAAPAIWPGSHEASNLTKQFMEWNKKAYQPTPEDLAKALEVDIELAPFDVFAPRLRRFLNEQLPSMLAKPWKDLAWHVDYRCKGCEFLGHPVSNHPDQCWPTADVSNHLSRVFGLSRGARAQLQVSSIKDVPSLAAINPASSIFNEHQGLRAKRTAFPYRASVLGSASSSIIPNSGGDALMPAWPALHIYIFLDYDLSSAITASIAMRAFWREPLPFGTMLAPQKLLWTQKQGEDEVFLVDSRSIGRERDEFLKFLRQLRKIFDKVASQDTGDNQAGRRDKGTAVSTYQIYLWDESQRKHLVRLISRHLSHILADPHLRDLAWLFPPPELIQLAEDATRQSPITLVSTVVANTIAVPIPHHYRLLDIVQTYRPSRFTSIPSIHPFYEEAMSDLIPPERIHEWWQRIGRWQDTQDLIQETARKKIYYMNLVVERLETDLKEVLSRQAAPKLARTPKRIPGIAPQSRLWLEYTRLNSSLDSLEVHTIRSMPPHEREARLKSARLTQRLSGPDEQHALASLRLTSNPNLLIYKMGDGSHEVNIKPMDFLYALAPENTHGFLDESPFPYIKGTSLQGQVYGKTIADTQMTGVTVEAIDRINGFIALRMGSNCYIRQLEQETKLDFSQNAILDPIHKDFLTSKIELTVRGIANPSIAIANQRVLETLGLPSSTQPGTSAPSPAAEILWEAPRIHSQKVNRDISLTRSTLESYFHNNCSQLDPSQWSALEEALSRRLSLIWGPPGTGKSRTLRTIILGAVLDAYANSQPLRLLVTANTYTAVDNVLLELDKELKVLLPTRPYEICRVQSKWQPVSPKLSDEHPYLNNLALNTTRPSTQDLALRERLEYPNGIIIVGCPPQQLHNLSVAGRVSNQRRPKDTIRSWFDLIILDEASQIDVASSTLIFTKLDGSGSCVLAGDDLQLPPIQQADPPTDLENVVGSAYNYFSKHHGIVPSSLDINYRSNKTIIEFVKLAGYSPKLTSFSPDLQLNLLSPLPSQKPLDWPTSLFWCTEWEKFLDPSYPAVCFVYDDNLSSQVNDFESDAVASLIWLLYGRQADRLLNERTSSGSTLAASSTAYPMKAFWDKAVGVVTPHRAQMGKIVNRLQQIFPSHSPEDIRNAVDTVERFQGQQRDVIIASMGIGDPDIISSEDEFLYNLNRFNVLTSRARAKLIVFITRSLLEHLSDDSDVLQESRLLKQFAESYCANPQKLDLGFLKNQLLEKRSGIIRRK